MKIHPHLIILFLTFSCSQEKPDRWEVVANGSVSMQFITDSLVQWYSNWHETEVSYVFAEEKTGILQIEFLTSGKLATHELILGTVAEADSTRIPVLLRYSEPEVAAFFQSNLMRNRLTTLSVKTTDPISYQIVIGNSP